MSFARSILRLGTRNVVAASAGMVVALYALAALAAPLIAPYDPLAICNQLLEAPSYRHPLGTDQLGRDILSRILFGARLSFQVSIQSVAIALLVGTTLGSIAGFFGRWVDHSISRLLDLCLAIPEILFALVILAIVGPGTPSLILAIGIVYTPIFARLARGQVIAVRSELYVEAARSLGESELVVLLRHILPATIPMLIVQTTLSLAFALLTEAALSFLGLSGQPDAPSWGVMLGNAKEVMELAWWVAVFPGIAITGLVLSLNLVGDGLRRWLDPASAS